MASYGGTKVKLFLDGVLAGEAQATGAISYSSSQLTIGAFKADGLVEQYSQHIHHDRVWDGIIADTPEELRTACPNTEPYLHYDSTIVAHHDTTNFSLAA